MATQTHTHSCPTIRCVTTESMQHFCAKTWSPRQVCCTAENIVEKPRKSQGAGVNSQPTTMGKQQLCAAIVAPAFPLYYDSSGTCKYAVIVILCWFSFFPFYFFFLASSLACETPRKTVNKKQDNSRGAAGGAGCKGWVLGGNARAWHVFIVQEQFMLGYASVCTEHESAAEERAGEVGASWHINWSDMV